MSDNILDITDILRQRNEFEAKTDKFGYATGSPIISILFKHIDNLNAEITALRIQVLLVKAPPPPPPETVK